MNYQAGAFVSDIADPARRGKIVKAGPEVSEVRFDDGAERLISNDHLRLWALEDRPRDIAKVIIDKLTKTKAEKVALAILVALKKTKEESTNERSTSR
jgi:hypothetical protein